MSPISFRTFLLVALTAPLAAQGKAPADVFPARSYGFFEFAGLASCSKACDELGLVQIVKGMLDRGGKEMLEQVGHTTEADALRFVRDRLERLGIDREALRTVLQGRVAVGFGRPVLFGPAMLPSIALVVDVAGREAAAERMLELGRQTMRQRVQAVEETREIRGVKAQVLRPAKLEGAIAFARLGNLQVVTNSVPFLEEIVATQQGKSQALTSEPGYMRPRARLAQPPLLAAYVSVRPLGEFLSWVLPYEVSSIAQAVGVTGCDSFFAGVAPAGKGGTDVLHVGATCPEDGLLRKVLTGRGAGQAAAWCADETGLFLTTSVDTKALIADLPRVLESLPAAARREIERETRRGLPLQQVQELLESIGPEIAIAVSLPLKKSLIPDVTFLVKVADAAKVERMLLESVQVGGSDGPSWKETEYQGTKIHYMNVKAGPVALSPSFATKDGWLIASQQVLALKAVLGRGMRADNPIAKALAQDAAQSAVPMRLVARLNAAAQTYYDMAIGAVPADAGFDTKILPSKEELQEQLGDATGSVEIGPDGVSLRATRPGSFAEVVAAVGGLVDWVLAGGERKRKVF